MHSLRVRLAWLVVIRRSQTDASSFDDHEIALVLSEKPLSSLLLQKPRGSVPVTSQIPVRSQPGSARGFRLGRMCVAIGRNGLPAHSLSRSVRDMVVPPSLNLADGASVSRARVRQRLSVRNAGLSLTPTVPGPARSYQSERYALGAPALMVI